MKKTVNAIFCAVGGAMIGFFANQLDSIVGCVLFTLGVALLVSSIILISKDNNSK